MESILCELKPVKSDRQDVIAYLKLNRPQKSNAFDGTMIRSFVETLKKLPKADCRALVISGEGRHLCAGADIQWLKETNSPEASFNEAREMLTLFETLSHLEIPVLTIAKGAVFGGGIGLVACSDIVLSEAESTFCFSEVRLGIIPAVIWPYVARKMPENQLMTLALTARRFSAQQAKDWGLVTQIFSKTDSQTILSAVLNDLLKTSPEAQRRLKRLAREVRNQQGHQSEYTAKAIAEARLSPEGQEGMRAFFEKRVPTWVTEL